MNQALKSMPPSLQADPSFKDLTKPVGDWKMTKENLLDLLEAREVLGQKAKGDVASPQNTAKEILSSRSFTDSGVSGERNWLSRVFEKLFEEIAEILNRLFGNRRTNLDIKPPSVSLGFLTPLVWVIIGAAVVAFLIFVIMKFRIGPLKKKKLGGLLEEDEPERTADEWLSRADELAALGRHREAIRCLYLACLVRFDDANVARFVRSETNWEHLRRISVSPKRPETVDFRPATEMFDLIWYGYKPTGEDDMRKFRAIYQNLCQDLKLKVA